WPLDPLTGTFTTPRGAWELSGQPEGFRAPAVSDRTWPERTQRKPLPSSGLSAVSIHAGLLRRSSPNRTVAMTDHLGSHCAVNPNLPHTAFERRGQGGCG